MAALIARWRRMVGDAGPDFWVGMTCFVGIPAVLYIIVRT